MALRQILRTFSSAPSELHCPVMKDEIVNWLAPSAGQKIADFTFGVGGHTKALIDRCPYLTVFAMDRDEEAYKRALSLVNELKSPSRVVPLLTRFSDAVSSVERTHGWESASLNAVVMDLGPSSPQLDSVHRGFGLSQDAALDMRMDPPSVNPMTAAAVVNSLSSQHLARIFKIYGEDRNAKKIANAIAEHRFALGPLKTTQELAALVESAVGRPNTDSSGRVSHAATRIFLALRIFVNNELNELQCGLAAAHHLLRPGGLCAVISFHSLEDRIVKQEFRGHFGRAWETRWEGVERPTAGEVSVNRRARSAKVRLAMKVVK